MKRLLFFVIIFVFFIPLIQQQFPLVEEEKLKGSFVAVDPPKSWKENWFNGGFQNSFEQYFKEEIGFRPFFIRCFNQIQFDLFGKAKSAVVGEDGVLFEERYIKTKLGEDFLGKEAIKQKVENIETLTKQLKAVNKNLLIVLAPNKARYYKDKIPNSFAKIDTSNYEVFVNEFKQKKIDYIDFNNWFFNQKELYEYKLIPKYGIHWSNYGAYLATDSIIKFCNSKFQYSIPYLKLDSIISTKTPRTPDYDIGETLNLFTLLDDETYFYPEYSIVRNSTCKKKNLLVISDSFFDQIYSTKFSTEIFNKTHYWYYNREVRGVKKHKKNDNDLKNTLPNTDLVIIMMTEWNLYRIGFGVIEEMNSFYSGAKIENSDVRHYIDRIKSDKEWLKEVQNQAVVRGISVDSMIVRAARYVVNKKK